MPEPFLGDDAERTAEFGYDGCQVVTHSSMPPNVALASNINQTNRQPWVTGSSSSWVAAASQNPDMSACSASQSCSSSVNLKSDGRNIIPRSRPAGRSG